MALPVSPSPSPRRGTPRARKPPYPFGVPTGLGISLLFLALLFLVLVVLQLRLFLSVPSYRDSPANPAESSSGIALTTAASDAACPFGYVYVYDVPPQFNDDVLAACDSLAPWYSLCPAFENAGFGLPAAQTNLSLILPARLLPSWYATDQFSLEQIFHIRALSHRCRTEKPELATAFYLPFYAGLAVGRRLWLDDATAEDRDSDCVAFLRWLSQQPAFRSSNGGDHFIALGRITWDFRREEDKAWGSSFLKMPAMANVTRLLIERDTEDPNDVGIPYPTGFHPRNAAAVRDWAAFVKSQPRRTLYSFAGGGRSYIKGDFRAILQKECESSGALCRSVDCSEGMCIKNNALAPGLFLDSKFCLQPRGDSFTRRSLFDCIVAGAVPVLFWKKSAYEKQYEWYLPEEGGKSRWSVFIDRREVRRGAVNITSFLSGIGEDQVRRMRDNVVEMIPRLVYAGAGDVGLDEGMSDAFDIALDGVLRRFRSRRSF